MAGASIKIDSAALNALLERALAAGSELYGLMEAMGGHLEFSTARHFEQERDPDGNPWPASLRALTESGQTLTKTARLRQSITTRVTPTSAEVGTNVVYAAIHQFSGEVKREARTVTLYRHYDAASDTFDPKFRKKKRSNFATDHQVGPYTVKVPARPFLGVGPADVGALREIARDWLRDATGGQA